MPGYGLVQDPSVMSAERQWALGFWGVAGEVLQAPGAPIVGAVLEPPSSPMAGDTEIVKEAPPPPTPKISGAMIAGIVAASLAALGIGAGTIYVLTRE